MSVKENCPQKMGVKKNDFRALLHTMKMNIRAIVGGFGYLLKYQILVYITRT